jgi:hypothetical protein
MLDLIAVVSGNDAYCTGLLAPEQLKDAVARVPLLEHHHHLMLARSLGRALLHKSQTRLVAVQVSIALRSIAHQGNPITIVPVHIGQAVQPAVSIMLGSTCNESCDVMYRLE